MSLRQTLHMKPGSEVILLGNEAVARGAIEAGVAVAAAYPGTPSTEIVESLSEVAKDLGIYVEWSTNEKVAFEVAYAAASMGTRALVAMKHVGLNVAADPLMSSAYTGVEESLVIVSADDPSMWSSQNEQDNRIYGLHAYIPVFEPNTVAEVKDLTKFVFDFSSEVKHPVILRLTTRIAHVRVPIVLGPIREPVRNTRYTKKPHQYVLIPAHARRLRKSLIERWKIIEEKLSHIPFNRIEGDGKTLIIASGISYAYVVEALKQLQIMDKVKILKLSTPVPIPRKLLLEAVSNVDKILVVEELEPVVEMQIKNLLYDEGIRIPIHGKDFIGLEYEMTLERVMHAIAKFLDISITIPKPITSEVPDFVFPRPPQLCPGCPYRPLFYVLRRIADSFGKDREPIFTGDIGCYTLGLNEPFRVQDTCICMGASIGLANGYAHLVEDRPVIAIIGDSTFYHAGIPPLINAVYNKAPILVIVLDNRITAMTGHQPHPGTGYTATGDETHVVKVEELAKAIGIEYVSVVDPFNIRETEKVLREAIEYVEKMKKPALIISRRACALYSIRRALRAGLERPLYVVDVDKCVGCGICYNKFACPAIRQISAENRKAIIDPELCTGCGVCVDICPVKAIRPAKEFNREEWLKYWT